jgi:hypothetical protein
MDVPGSSLAKAHKRVRSEPCRDVPPVICQNTTHSKHFRGGDKTKNGQIRSDWTLSYFVILKTDFSAKFLVIQATFSSFLAVFLPHRT